MSFIKDFISEYGTQILFAVLTTIAGYVGIAVKKIYEKYVSDHTKKEVVGIAVHAVEQLYKELHGEEKLEKALMYASDMLESRGINFSAVELRLLVEAAVGEFNEAFKSDGTVVAEKSNNALPDDVLNESVSI